MTKRELFDFLKDHLSISLQRECGSNELNVYLVLVDPDTDEPVRICRDYVDIEDFPPRDNGYGGYR